MVTDGSGKIAVDTGVTATELGYLDATSSIQTQLDAKATLAGSTFTGEVTMSDDLIVSGNLTVSGDTVQQDVTNLKVEDRIILAASGASGSPSLDTGLMMSRGTEGNVFIGYDESVNKVVVAHTRSPQDNTSISATSAANLDAAAITATSITIGSASINETELEILDGATLSTTELNYVDGVTSAIQTQLAAHTTEDTAIETRRTNNIAGAISSVLTSDLTASRVMVTDGSGKISVDTGVTATELGYLDATSSIQTQLDAAGGGGSAGTGSLKGNDPTSTDYLGANHDCGAALVATEDVFTEAIAARTDLDLLKQPLYSLGTIDNGSVA